MPQSERAEYGICEILRGARPAGLGFTIDLTHVVTCAHVVNTALGRADKLDRALPVGDEVVGLRFPIGSAPDDDARWTARVIEWLPGRAGSFEMNDIAVLELTRPAPAHVRGLRPRQYRHGMSVQMWGPQRDRSDGGHVKGMLLGEVRGGRIQIDVADGPFRVRPGFSGGPVWDTSTGDVVGVLSACGVGDDAVDAYLLGIDRIAEAWPQWMQQDPAADPAGQPGQDPASRRRRHLQIASAGSAAAAVLAAVAIIASMHTPSRGHSPGPSGTRQNGPATAGQTLRAATPGAPVAVGSRPFGIAITPDGKTAYVADNGGNTVTPINLATGTPGHPITVGNQPYAIAITPDGKTAYVTNSGDGTVTPIDVRAGTTASPIQVGHDPEWIAITPDGTTAYVADHMDGTVTPINLRTGAPGAPVPAGNGPNRIAITRDGKTAYVTDQNTNTITPISIPGDVPGPPITVSIAPDGIAITPDGKNAYTTDNGFGMITPINLATGFAGPPISESSPIGIVIAPDGKTAYVANYALGTVTPMSLPANVFGTPVRVGNRPVAIAITPDGRTAYVTNNGDGTVTPISLPAD